MSCYVKLCIGFTIIFFNLLLCDNPFNVLFGENKHWCSTEAKVAFVTQTQKEKKHICQNIFYK
uniref:Uncharacterized protein n=1 Tax=Anguilla anguilla TaxID=7936 RepID=A0A0E9WWT0_ANGAN